MHKINFEYHKYGIKMIVGKSDRFETGLQMKFSFHIKRKGILKFESDLLNSLPDLGAVHMRTHKNRNFELPKEGRSLKHLDEISIKPMEEISPIFSDFDLSIKYPSVTNSGLDLATPLSSVNRSIDSAEYISREKLRDNYLKKKYLPKSWRSKLSGFRESTFNHMGSATNEYILFDYINSEYKVNETLSFHIEKPLMFEVDFSDEFEEIRKFREIILANLSLLVSKDRLNKVSGLPTKEEYNSSELESMKKLGEGYLWSEPIDPSKAFI